MNYQSILRRCAIVCLTPAFAVVTVPAAADVVMELDDIVYQDSDWGQSEMRKRGYSKMSSDRHHHKQVEYWWNGGNNTCARVTYDGNKVGEIASAPGTDCGQYHSDATDNNSDAAIAIGAIALIGGIAALAHQSHQRDDKHGEDSQSVAEFDRGYRDGMHHETYHNYNNTDAYSDGYSTGVDERNDQTSYRASSSGHSGYRSYAPVDDLVGARGSSAESELQSRGFRDAGGYKQDDKSIVMWWNQQTNQCISVTTANGRIDTIDDIDANNCQ